MGDLYKIFEFTNLNRQDGQNGRIKDYELYISEDTLDWGDPVSTGQFENTAAPQTIVFEEPPVGRYFRLLALSEVNGNDWASAAEFSLVGCIDFTSYIKRNMILVDLAAFPVPTTGLVTVPLPSGKSFKFSIFSSGGKLAEQGEIESSSASYVFDMHKNKPGIYLIRLQDKTGCVYRVKVIKR